MDLAMAFVEPGHEKKYTAVFRIETDARGINFWSVDTAGVVVVRI